MGSVKHIIAGMALAAALVGFAFAMVMRPHPAPPAAPAQEREIVPQSFKPAGETPEAEERAPAIAPAPEAVPVQTVPSEKKVKPSTPPVTRFGSRDHSLELADAAALDGAALAGVTTGQATGNETSAGLAHRLGTTERMTETAPVEFTPDAPPPLKPQDLDKLIPFFAPGTTTNLNISHANRIQ